MSLAFSLRCSTVVFLRSSKRFVVDELDRQTDRQPERELAGLEKPTQARKKFYSLTKTRGASTGIKTK